MHPGRDPIRQSVAMRDTSSVADCGIRVGSESVQARQLVHGMDRVLRQAQGLRQRNQKTGRGWIAKEMRLVGDPDVESPYVRTEDEPRVPFGKRSWGNLGADSTETEHL